MEKIAPYGKAITGALVSGIVTLIALWEVDGSLSALDVLKSFLDFLIVGGAVWAIPNAVKAVKKT